MARAPRAGAVKTRLQPLLGPGGCAQLQSALLRRTVTLARQVAPAYLAIDGPADLGVPTFPQEGDDLGARMRNAVERVGGPVVVIGTDVPTLTADHLREAMRRLADHDVVFGPALDGGYYLIALRDPRAEPFAIDPALWGGPQVLRASVAAAEAAGLRVGMLDPLRDLDTPEDARALLPELPDEIAALLAPVSIVVPVLDEADRIETTLRRLRRDFPGCELVVVDGGSRDDTAELAEPLARVIRTGPGRGRQLNEGAAHTSGDVLWFVHADTVIAPDALAQLRAALADPGVIGGGLTLRFDRRSAGLDWLAWTSNQRSRRLHWIFGDQAMFVRRSTFDALGGFPDLPIMEDLEMSRRLARHGRLVLLPAASTASARRFEAHGTWRMVAFMQYLKALYFAGADPESIRRRYEAGTWT